MSTTLISSTIGYAIFVGIFVIICGLYAAKSWLHKKCKKLLIENDSLLSQKNGNLIGGNTERTEIQTHQPT